jgi:hypothetical protein
MNEMIRWWGTLLMVLIWLWPSVPEADACSCVPPEPPDQAVRDSAAVFSGKVVRVYGGKNAQEKTVELEVVRVWKGIGKPRVTLKTHSHSASCGFPFREGETYLVYSQKDGHGDLTTSICSRTRRMSQASEDLEALGPGKTLELPRREHNDTMMPPEKDRSEAMLIGGGVLVLAAVGGWVVWKRKKP